LQHERCVPQLCSHLFSLRGRADPATDYPHRARKAAGSHGGAGGEGIIYAVRPAVRVDHGERDTGDEASANTLVTAGLSVFFGDYNDVSFNMDIDKPGGDGAKTETAFRVQFRMHI